jgi:hypothetical protein
MPFVLYFYHETNIKYVSYRLREMNDFEAQFQLRIKGCRRTRLDRPAEDINRGYYTDF